MKSFFFSSSLGQQRNEMLINRVKKLIVWLSSRDARKSLGLLNRIKVAFFEN